jgi:hypothetical protein
VISVLAYIPNCHSIRPLRMPCTAARINSRFRSHGAISRGISAQLSRQKVNEHKDENVAQADLYAGKRVQAHHTLVDREAEALLDVLAVQDPRRRACSCSSCKTFMC